MIRLTPAPRAAPLAPALAPALALALALALAALALAGCATPAAHNRDVVAVVQDEQGRQAVAQALDQGKPADEALARASEASDRAKDPPH